MDWAISTENLTRKFGGFTAVDRLNIKINSGEVCGFLGPNGAGKSTAIRMLCGILEPSSGSARILGYDLHRQTETIKKNIGYMSQKFSLYEDLSVYENLDFFAGLYSIPYGERRHRIDEMLALAGLTGQEDERVFTLSPGYKQRLALGSAILSRPSILFLDEPTSGVSPSARRAFFNIIQELAGQGTTIIVTTHFMDEAERCDKIAFFNQGRLMALDTPDKLKSEVLEGVLLELDLPAPMERMTEILALPFVKECSLHGLLLHVLVERDSERERLEQLFMAKAHPIIPSLEDIFIALAKKREEVVV